MVERPTLRLLKNYVDDARSICGIFPPGTTFVRNEGTRGGRFEVTCETCTKHWDENIDLVLMTQKLTLEALNSISGNLTLTMEDFQDFENMTVDLKKITLTGIFQKPNLLSLNWS